MVARIKGDSAATELFNMQLGGGKTVMREERMTVVDHHAAAHSIKRWRTLSRFTFATFVSRQLDRLLYLDRLVIGTSNWTGRSRCSSGRDPA